jgi:hypothetical protein
MVLTANEPIRGLFDDEDRQIATRWLGEQQQEIDRRRETVEAAEIARDRRIVDEVGQRRQAAGKPWTDEMAAQMLARRAEQRQLPGP